MSIKSKINLRVTEKSTFEGFKKESPRVYKNVNKLVRLGGRIMIYIDDVATDCLDEFYYQFEIA